MTLLILVVHKIKWPLLYLFFLTITLGLIGLYWWDPKRKMKDDLYSANFKALGMVIVNFTLSIYILIEFIKSFS